MHSFRVSARRADKRFPLTSPQVEREIGGRIKEARGWRVDLEHADLVVHVELLSDQAFYFFGKERGAGGLPTGTAGAVVCLLSGGIDSPVAAHRMMKRGCVVTFVHFHSYPILSRASQEKARELVTLLTKWQQRSRLYLIAFGEIQQQVVLAVPGPMRVVVYRRLMMRIAERIAVGRRAHALVTGDVVGQVASQTLENLGVVSSVATLPIFRPLIGFDKEEITAEAIAIGSYPISIIPDQDCCTLFTPRNPLTRARLAQIEAAETALPIEALVDRAVADAVVEDFNFPVIGSEATRGARSPAPADRKSSARASGTGSPRIEADPRRRRRSSHAQVRDDSARIASPARTGFRRAHSLRLRPPGPRDGQPAVAARHRAARGHGLCVHPSG